jgi:hypothetical protein
VGGFVDCHSHVCPSGDDGARDIGEGVVLCGDAARHGTRLLFATPHVWPQLPLSADRERTIRAALAALEAQREHVAERALGERDDRAEGEAVAIAERAAEEGRQAGFAAGAADARERVEPALAALAAAVVATDSPRRTPIATTGLRLAIHMDSEGGTAVRVTARRSEAPEETG